MGIFGDRRAGHSGSRRLRRFFATGRDSQIEVQTESHVALLSNPGSHAVRIAVGNTEFYFIVTEAADDLARGTVRVDGYGDRPR